MNWEMIVRETGLVEWVCEHGTGHPDMRSARKLAKKYGHSESAWTTHGCDSCCRRKDFPGRLRKAKA